MTIIATLAPPACGADTNPDAPRRVPLEEVVAVVGGAGGAPAFAEIHGVRAVDDGSFLVLDALNGSIALYGTDGTPRSHVTDAVMSGAETAMDVSSTGRIVVRDPMRARLRLYHATADGISHVADVLDAWANAPTGQSVCALGDRVFVRDLRDGRLIHEIGENGRILQSFEEAAPPPAEASGPLADAVAAQINSGHLLCLDEPPLVVSMGQYLPHVRAFTPDGRLVWETQVRDLRPWRITVSPDSGVSYMFDPINGSHSGVSVQAWDSDNLIVQYAVSRDTRAPEDVDLLAVETRVLARSTGRELGWLDGLPFVAATRGELLYSFQNQPSPSVTVLRRLD